MYKQNKNILMIQPSNVPSLEVYSLAASEPNKPINCLWSADVNINASFHLVILFKSMVRCLRPALSSVVLYLKDDRGGFVCPPGPELEGGGLGHLRLGHR